MGKKVPLESPKTIFGTNQVKEVPFRITLKTVYKNALGLPGVVTTRRSSGPSSPPVWSGRHLGGLRRGGAGVEGTSAPEVLLPVLGGSQD